VPRPIRYEINDHGGLASQETWNSFQETMIEAMVRFDEVIRANIPD
jgi:hypothetical protein